MRTLHRGQILKCERLGELRVLKGKLWVTSTGDSHDWILKAGDRLDLRGHHGILIQSLSDTILKANVEDAGKPLWPAEFVV